MNIRPAVEAQAQCLSALVMCAKAYWNYAPEALDRWRAELAVSARDIRDKPTFIAILHALQAAARGGTARVLVDADPNAEPFYLNCGAVRCGTVLAPIPGQPDRVRPQLAFDIRTAQIAEDRAT